MPAMRRHFAFLVLLANLTAPALGAASRDQGLPATFVPPPILMYHRVDVETPRDRVSRDLTVTPAQFAEQLAYLKEQGDSAISVAELERRLSLGLTLDHLVVITFDDGYADQYRYAVPILQRYAAGATFYIITGSLDRPGHLTGGELRLMAASGFDIAAHGVSHSDLSHMTSAQQTYQIDGSVLELRRLRFAVESYAYPSGRFNAQTLALMRQSGIPLAFTTDAKYVIAPKNRFELTRLRVRSMWSLREFARALEATQAHAQIVER